MVPSSAPKAAITVSMCNRKWELELGGTRHPEISEAHCSLLQDRHHTSRQSTSGLDNINRQTALSFSVYKIHFHSFSTYKKQVFNSKVEDTNVGNYKFGPMNKVHEICIPDSCCWTIESVCAGKQYSVSLDMAFHKHPLTVQLTFPFTKRSRGIQQL